MGTVRVVVTNYAAEANKNIPTSSYSDAAQHTSSGTASDVTGITVRARDVVQVVSDTNGWVRFNGVAAVGTGHPLTANVPSFFEVSTGDGGAISVIDG